MDDMPLEKNKLPGATFHLIFALAFLAAVLVIGLNAVSWFQSSCAHCLLNPHNKAAQATSVMLFTFASMALMLLRGPASILNFDDRPSLANFIEKRFFIDLPWLPRLLIAGAGIAFFLAMITLDRTEPAIFLMAVVAIYVAAEHLGGLHEHRQLLDLYKGNLDSLTNATGLQHGRGEIYKAYARSQSPIVAVVRTFDIDPEWFALNGNMESYKACQNLGTFYNSLKNAPQALFVSNLKLPVTGALSPAPGPSVAEMADQFNNLLGLAWQWCILQEISLGRAQRKQAPFEEMLAARARKKQAHPGETLVDRAAHKQFLLEKIFSIRVRKKQRFSFEIAISSTTNWIHVADDRVYQLIEGRVPREGMVRDLTLDVRNSRDLLESLLNWARGEVKRAAERGCSGDEYLTTTLYSFLHKDVSELAYLTRARLVSTLNELGMQQWISNKGNFVEGLDKDNQTMERLCLEIFERFLTGVTDDGRRAVTFSEELLGICKQEWVKPDLDAICPAMKLGREVV